MVLAWRDLKVRYAQTWLGVLWAVVNPLINLVILSFIFHRVADISTNGVPPLLYTAAGLAGWTYFSEVFGQAGDSFLSNQNMIKKVFFPRMALPLSKGLAALADLVIVLVLISILMLWYGVSPGWNILWLPAFVLLAVLAGVTGGLWMSAMTIRFRDFRFVVPVLLRVGLFITPIAYSVTSVPAAWRWLYYLNPLTAIVEGFKWILAGSTEPSLISLAGLLILVVLFFSGLLFFSKVEAKMADIL